MTSVLISPEDSNSELLSLLHTAGMRVRSWPTLRIHGVADDSSLRQAFENIFGYDWLVLKNLRAAEYFFRPFLAEHLPDELDEIQVLAVGDDVAAHIAKFQVHVDIMVERFDTGAINRSLQAYVGEDKIARLNLLVPSANIMRESFQQSLEEIGARVDSVAAYRTSAHADELIRLKALLTGGGIDFVAFSRAVQINELAILFDTDDLRQLLGDVSVLCLDESTKEAANEFGLQDKVMLSETFLLSLAQIVECGD